MGTPLLIPIQNLRSRRLMFTIPTLTSPGAYLDIGFQLQDWQVTQYPFLSMAVSTGYFPTAYPAWGRFQCAFDLNQ